MRSTFSLSLMCMAILLWMAGCSNEKQNHTDSVSSTQMSTPVAEPAPSANLPEPEPEPNVTSVTSAPALVHAPETSPTILYQRCAACHGNHAEKSALNQSAVIGDWDSKRIAASIVGYQDGTYGGAMKTLMQNQVKDLNRIQIEALSEYISHLYVKTH